MLFDEVKRERVVAGRHRRVCREDRGLPDLFERFVEVRPAVDQLANPLQNHEGGMALVQVKDRRFDAERAQGANAADAEDDFLLDARLAIAAVQPRRQLAVPGRVLLEVRVEQVELHAADAHAPDGHEHRPVVERDRREARLAIGCRRLFDRGVHPVEHLVALFLPAVGRNVLVEVALGIHEADADERYAEVARLLAVVARQHAKTAGIDRQRLMQRELGGEVGDRLPRQVRQAMRPPRIVRRVRRVERGDGSIVEREELRVVRRRFEPLARQHPRACARGCARSRAMRVVEAPEDRAPLGMPAPPEIGGEILETGDARGKRRRGDSGSL